MTLNRSIRWQGLDLKTLEHAHVVDGRDTHIRGTIVGPDFGLFYRLKLDENAHTRAVKIERADEKARVAVMRAQAKDARGQGTASATITSSMEEVPDGTRVKVETDMRVTGPAAQFGRGVMQDVSAKLMRQFADCLASEMSAAPAGVNGSAPETGPEIEAEPEPTAAQAPAPEPAAATNGGPRPAPEPLDLVDASREALLKRAVPIVGALVALLILFRLIRR